MKYSSIENVTKGIETVANYTAYRLDKKLVTITDIACKINVTQMLIGTVGNILCMYVFMQKKLKSRKFNCYLLILASFELLFCLIVSVDYIFRIFYKKQMFLHDVNVYTNMAIDFSIHTTDSYVVMLTLILSIDRLYAIKNPTKIRDFITSLHSKFLIIATFIGLVVLKTPGFLFCYENSEKNFNIIYCTLISPLICNILPTIITLVLNSLLVYQIIRYYRNISNEKSQMVPKTRFKCQNYAIRFSRDTNEARILMNGQRMCFRPIKRIHKSHYLVIVILAAWSVLTTIPYYTLNTFYLLFHFNLFSNLTNFKTIEIVQIVSSILFNSNHCVNFFIYISFYQEFRNSLFKSVSVVFLKRISFRSIS